MSTHTGREVAGRAVHDVALAALLGGNLFGQYALNPALEAVSDKSERGKVLNLAWRRYGNVNSLALATVMAEWLPARVRSGFRRAAGSRLERARDIAMSAVVVTGLASAAGGVGFARQAPAGAVPMESGDVTAAETPPRAVRLKHMVNVLATLNLLSELALFWINAACAAPKSRRSPRLWPLSARS